MKISRRGALKVAALGAAAATGVPEGRGTRAAGSSRRCHRDAVRRDALHRVQGVRSGVSRRQRAVAREGQARCTTTRST